MEGWGTRVSELPSVRNRQVDKARGTRNRVVTRDPRKEVISLLAWLDDVFFVCADNGWLQCPGNQRKKLPDATCPGLFQKWKAQLLGCAIGYLSQTKQHILFFLILEDYSIFVEQIKLAQDCEVSIEEVNPFFFFKRQRWGSLVAFVYHVDLREIARKKTSCKVQRAF